jgi:tetratricopeptide (TPR) repeat protein
MEFLKKTIAILIAFISFNSYAQDYKTLQDAFANSIVLESSSNFKGAIEAIKKINTSTNYETNIRLGWLSYVAGNHVESKSYYEKATLIMPASCEPLWGLTYPLAELKKWAELAEVYQKILRLDPKNMTANYRLGLSAYYGKDYSIAKKYFDIVLGLYPMDYNTLLMSAWTNYFLGKKTEAKILFNKTLIVMPSDKSATEGLGLIK